MVGIFLDLVVAEGLGVEDHRLLHLVLDGLELELLLSRGLRTFRRWNDLNFLYNFLGPQVVRCLRRLTTVVTSPRTRLLSGLLGHF